MFKFLSSEPEPEPMPERKGKFTERLSGYGIPEIALESAVRHMLHDRGLEGAQFKVTVTVDWEMGGEKP